MIPDFAAGAPPRTGIYIMRDSAGTVIYVGKAKNLRNRVRSYFSGRTDYKTGKLVEKISGMEFVMTDSESEAFVLESNMIKRHRPRFNMELKDQERYTYLRLSDEKYPRLTVARRARGGKLAGPGRVYGPFTHGSSKLLTVGSLRKAFKIRICKTLPKKVCLEYHLGNCEGPCEIASAQDSYARHVKDLQGVLSGGDSAAAFAEWMDGQMRKAADSHDFERAIEMRDTLKRLSALRAPQKMDSPGGPDEEYFGVDSRGGRAVVMTFRKAGGVIRDSDRFSFEVMADNTFGNFIYQYYTTRPIPGRVLTSRRPENARALAAALSEKAGKKVEMAVPRSGPAADMIALIMRNIDLIHSEGGADPALARLQERLQLPALPRAVECFDVSNHGDEFAVGAMSRLLDGRPDKSGYRKFRIKTVKGRDDFAMIAEVVGRRYSRLLREGAAMPDLVLIDGGAGQLSSALAALKRVGADVPCASLAKENEEVFMPGRAEPVRMQRTDSALHVLQRARDEAHRFSVAYNRAIRKKAQKSG